MYNLIEYSHNYSKASGNLYQCYRNKSFLDYNEAIASFLVNNNSVLLKVKTKIVVRTEKDGTKNVKLMVPLNNVRVIYHVLFNNQLPTFALTDTKLFAQVLTLPTQGKTITAINIRF